MIASPGPAKAVPLGNLAHRIGSEVAAADDEMVAGARPGCQVSLVTDRSLSLGVRQTLETPAALRARSEGIPLVHRSTGGTGVLTEPGDLAWSLVLPVSHPLVGRDFVRAYDRLGRGVVAALGDCGVAVDWGAPPGVSEDLCVLGSRGQVLTGGGRILGGAAQRRTGRALLHHGYLARHIDPPRLSRIFDVPSGVIIERLAGWEELGVHASSEELGELILGHLQREIAR